MCQPRQPGVSLNQYEYQSGWQFAMNARQRRRETRMSQEGPQKRHVRFVSRRNCRENREGPVVVGEQWRRVRGEMKQGDQGA